MRKILDHIIHNFLEGFPCKLFCLLEFRALLVDEILRKVVLVWDMLSNAADFVELIQLIRRLQRCELLARICC